MYITECNMCENIYLDIDLNIIISNNNDTNKQLKVV